MVNGQYIDLTVCMLSRRQLSESCRSPNAKWSGAISPASVVLQMELDGNINIAVDAVAKGHRYFLFNQGRYAEAI